MRLGPDISELLARARADLRIGVPVVLADGPRRLVIAAVETLGAERLAALRGLGGTVALAVTARRAETLKARVYDGDLARIALPEDAELAWVQAVADPKDDLSLPMKGPLRAARGGEAGLYRLALLLAKSARLLPAVVAVEPREGLAGAALEGLTLLFAAQTQSLLETSAQLSDVVHARVPTRTATETRLHIFRPEDGGEEHYAIEVGKPARDKPVLARLHSACFTGDVMGSLKCDCGPQLNAALAQMGAEGAGLLLYLNQEGRGIGLANKMRAYSLQDQGFDTVEANHRLGFEDDERDFRVGASILKEMGFAEIRLMTNNPAKIEMMVARGIKVVERVPLIVGETDYNRAYLDVKARKSGHML